MKKILLYICLIAVMFAQCTPKTTDKITKSPEVTAPEVVTAPPALPTPEAPKAKTFRSEVPAAGPAPRIQMGSAEQFALDNGLQVILVENHKLPRVSYQLYVDVPALNEGESAGTIQMAGDMLNKGTSSKTKSQIDESIDFIGASLNTNANGMFGAALKKYNKDLLEIMSDVLLNPNFPKAEFEKAKKQYASGLSQEKDDASTLAANISNKVKYGKDHPYGEFMTESTLENITLEGIKEYYQKWFKPNIAYLIVVGDITRAEAEPLVKQYFSKWKADASLKNNMPAVPTQPSNNEVTFINKTGAVQSVINVTYPVDLKPGSSDVIKASVMNTLLGAGVYFGNRLNQNLRETNAYTYGARSSLSSDKYVGSFSAGASVRNEVTDSSIVEIFNEMNTIRNVKVDEAELQKVKNVLNGSFARSLESPQTIARFALNTALYDLPEDYYSTYLEKLAAVTSDDLMAMANKYIKPENAHIVVVGNQDDVAADLKRFGQDGKVQFYNTNYEKIVQPKQTIPAGTTAKTILADYLKAIGGEAAMDKINSVEMVMKGNIMGQDLAVEVYQQKPNKFANLTSMAGNVVNSEVLNGDKGMVSGMGGAKKLTGDELLELKEKADLFRERTFIGSKDYTLELVGIEEVEGKPAYKVKVTGPTASKTIDFYDTTSKLKVRSIITTEAEGQTTVQTVNISDYKEVKGVKFPHRLIVSGGGMPMTLDLKTDAVKVNEAIDESIFSVE